MTGRFYFGDDSAPDSQTPTTHSETGNDYTHSPDETNNDDDYDYDFDTLRDSLPFPKPLSRPSFLTPEFEPHAFLASLSASNRFQTLEDLQAELRELSATINRELVDLVNANYEEFVSLGADLRGGEEKVEEVRVGLLGFEKDVGGLRAKVVERRAEVAELIARKKELRKEVGLGRGLLEIDERFGLLEVSVGLKERMKRTDVNETEVNGDVKWSEGWDDEGDDASDEEYGDEEGVSGQIRMLVENYLIARTLVKKYDPAHPFLVAQKGRMQRIQERVRVELDTAIRAADNIEAKQELIQMKAQMDL